MTARGTTGKGTTGTQPLHTAETTQLQADPTGMQRQIMSGTLGVAALQAFGVYLFISGFLCTRQELANRSSCADPQALCTAWLPCSLAYAGPRECSSAAKRTVPEFRFVVLLIVDALRFDVAPEFPTMARLLARSPAQSRLMKFVADAPTTTMQRLKGLTTGGLPTFVDIGRSFDAGIDIQEDNWVHGAMRAGHRISVIGDDTWVSLFPPERLTKAQPYPSLNVKDIDGCDDFVRARLPAELAEAASQLPSQRSVVVGHFLGIDHIGHRYGLEHAEFRNKIAQMDSVLNETVAWAKANKANGAGDTLVLMFGDHGQTVTGRHADAMAESCVTYVPLILCAGICVFDAGDHGGATAEEVESLLFAYRCAWIERKGGGVGRGPGGRERGRSREG